MHTPSARFSNNSDTREKTERLPVSGHIYIWKYIDNERNYPGWNITMDNLASQGVINLLDLMDQCEWSTNKTITTSQRPVVK